MEKLNVGNIIMAALLCLVSWVVLAANSLTFNSLVVLSVMGVGLSVVAWFLKKREFSIGLFIGTLLFAAIAYSLLASGVYQQWYPERFQSYTFIEYSIGKIAIS